MDSNLTPSLWCFALVLRNKKMKWNISHTAADLLKLLQKLLLCYTRATQKESDPNINEYIHTYVDLANFLPNETVTTIHRPNYYILIHCVCYETVLEHSNILEAMEVIGVC